jgi:hypothetical protein
MADSTEWSTADTLESLSQHIDSRLDFEAERRVTATAIGASSALMVTALIEILRQKGLLDSQDVKTIFKSSIQDAVKLPPDLAKAAIDHISKLAGIKAIVEDASEP